MWTLLLSIVNWEGLSTSPNPWQLTWVTFQWKSDTCCFPEGLSLELSPEECFLARSSTCYHWAWVKAQQETGSGCDMLWVQGAMGPRIWGILSAKSTWEPWKKKRQRITKVLNKANAVRRPVGGCLGNPQMRRKGLSYGDDHQDGQKALEVFRR